MNYTGNIRDAWHALDADGSGKVPSGLVDWKWVSPKLKLENSDNKHVLHRKATLRVKHVEA